MEGCKLLLSPCVNINHGVNQDYLSDLSTITLLKKKPKTVGAEQGIADEFTALFVVRLVFTVWQSLSTAGTASREFAST